MKAIWSIVLLIVTCNTAQAAELGDIRFDTNVASKHFVPFTEELQEATGLSDWNESNPGIGFEFQVSPVIYLATGVFENSYGDTSWFAGAGAYSKEWHIGIEAGPVGGYELSGDYFLVMPYTKLFDRPGSNFAAKLYIGLDPIDHDEYESKLIDYVSFQLQYKIGNSDSLKPSRIRR